MKFGLSYFQSHDYIQKPNYADMPLPELKKPWEPNTIAEIFVDDSVQKKRIGRGAQNKVGAGGRKVTFPSDLMSNKDKKAYTKERNSVSYNRNEVISLNAFNMLDKVKQKELLEHWFMSGIIGRNELAKKWDMTEYFLTKKINELQIQIPAEVWKKYRTEKAKDYFANLTPEEREERAQKHREAYGRKKKEQEAAEQEEQAKANAAMLEAIAREQLTPAPVAAAVIQPEPIQEAAIPIIAMPDMPEIHSSEKFSMKFEINNRSGVWSLETLGRMLAFMQNDNKTLYKLSINVEEI